MLDFITWLVLLELGWSGPPLWGMISPLLLSSCAVSLLCCRALRLVREGTLYPTTSLGWNGSCFLQQFCSGPFDPSALQCHVVQKPSFHWFKQVKRTNQDWPLLCAWTISPQCSSMSRDTESYISLVQAIVKRTNQDWGTLLWVCVGERGEPFHPRKVNHFTPVRWTISPQFDKIDN